MDLFNDIQYKSQQLTNAIKLLNEYGKKLAEAERDYKITLSQESLKLKNEQNLAVTLIDKVIYGLENVAQKRFKRDVAQTMYTTALENINVMKLQLRLLENQLQREWGNMK